MQVRDMLITKEDFRDYILFWSWPFIFQLFDFVINLSDKSSFGRDWDLIECLGSFI